MVTNIFEDFEPPSRIFLAAPLDLPCLTSKQKDFCKVSLGEKDLFSNLKCMPNRKTPRNDVSSKEFYKEFWNGLKDTLLKSFYHTKTYKEFSTLQRQAVIKTLDIND